MDKKLFFFLALLSTTFFIISCGSPSGTTISGTISDAKNLSVFLDKLELQANEIIHKTETNGSGKYSMNFPEGLEKGIYRIRAGAKSANLIIMGDEGKVNLSGSLDDFTKASYSVTGSPLTEDFVSTMTALQSKDYSREELLGQIEEKDPMLQLLMGLKTLPMSPQFGEAHAQIASRVVADLPDISLATEYAKTATMLQAQHKQMMASQKIKVGEMAPDITLTNPDGKEMSLSDLKGQVVLLDFWASWCGPCRRENPNVVKTYNKYKDKGFTVFSVSLDGVDMKTEQRLGSEDKIKQFKTSSKDRWVKAIQKDNLLWESHVSDLRKWDSVAAAEYGVRSIPKTFLINRDGTIAALNPRRNLEQELLKVL